MEDVRPFPARGARGVSPSLRLSIGASLSVPNTDSRREVGGRAGGCAAPGSAVRFLRPRRPGTHCRGCCLQESAELSGAPNCRDQPPLLAGLSSARRSSFPSPTSIFPVRVGGVGLRGREAGRTRKREPAVDSTTVMSLLTDVTGEFGFPVGDERVVKCGGVNAGWWRCSSSTCSRAPPRWQTASRRWLACRIVVSSSLGVALATQF
jgi:hypothetical protein